MTKEKIKKERGKNTKKYTTEQYERRLGENKQE